MSSTDLRDRAAAPPCLSSSSERLRRGGKGVTYLLLDELIMGSERKAAKQRARSNGRRPPMHRSRVERSS